MIPKLDDVIEAYECLNGPYPLSHSCKECSLGYGYLDDSGDSYSWLCNEEKWEQHAYFYLKLYQHLIEEKQK